MKNISRRTAIKTVLAGSAAMAVSGMEAAAPAKTISGMGVDEDGRSILYFF